MLEDKMNQLNEKLLEDREPTSNSARNKSNSRRSVVFVNSDDED